MKYTVILMYPDYATDNYGETWCSSVEAPDPVAAVEVAQEQCAKDNTSEIHPPDLLPVSVFEGEHEDLVGIWANANC